MNKAAAADSAGGGIGHADRQRGRHCCVDRVAAMLENLDAARVAASLSDTTMPWTPTAEASGASPAAKQGGATATAIDSASAQSCISADVNITALLTVIGGG